jgi:anthranilate/para-aminobenzoate synthase component I
LALPYGAFVDTGEWVIGCASPELFFRLDGNHIACSRPAFPSRAGGDRQQEKAGAFVPKRAKFLRAQVCPP